MQPAIFVLFGATGDLARRLVLPAFAAMAVNGLMPARWVLIGNGRKDGRRMVHRPRARRP